MSAPTIRFAGFTKTYDDVVAVDGLDLDVREGEVVALVGPNGSGKTTCLKAAVGLLRPTRGHVFVDGRDPRADGRLVRRNIGYLPQRLSFTEGSSAGEIVGLFAALRGLDFRDADRALERTGLDRVGDRRVGGFSGGMLQRLGLAVALMGDPRVLLVDEPTAALDPTGGLAIRDILDGIRREGRTIVFSSHDLGEVAALADRVAIFVDGRLRALGAPLELAAECGLAAAGAQSGSPPAADYGGAVASPATLENVYRRVTCGPSIVR